MVKGTARKGSRDSHPDSLTQCTPRGWSKCSGVILRTCHCWWYWIFFFWPRGMQDLLQPGDGTGAPCIGSAVLTTGLLGKWLSGRYCCYYYCGDNIITVSRVMDNEGPNLGPCKQTLGQPGVLRTCAKALGQGHAWLVEGITKAAPCR